MQKKIILIVGKSGSGKTYFRDVFNLSSVVSHTTRQKRKGEIDGVDYYFEVIGDKKAFLEKNASRIIAHTYYRGELYYSFKEDLQRTTHYDHDCYIIDPNGVHELLRFFDYDVFHNKFKVVVIDTSTFQRVKRIFKRAYDDCRYKTGLISSIFFALKTVTVNLKNDKVNFAGLKDFAKAFNADVIDN